MTEGPFGRRDEEPTHQEAWPGGAPEGEEPPYRKPGPPKPPPGLASNTTWIVGVLLVIVLAYVTINTINTDSNGSRGVETGQPIPPFAVPLALANTKCKGDEECDANVLLKESDGVPKACDVRGPDILNGCQLSDRGPLVLAFLVAPSQKCIDQVDLLERLKPRFPDVQFAAIAIKGDHGDVNALIRRHKWTLPVGYDHDGAIANAFAVAVCPTVTFVKQGGEVQATTLGTAPEREIVADIRRISR